MDMSRLAVAALATIAAGGVAYVFLYPYLSGDMRAEKRQKALAKPERAADRVALVNRRDQVAQSLKEIDDREKARNKITLEQLIAQAGLDWSRRKFFVMSIVIGLGTALALFVLTQNPYMAGAGLFIGILGLPRWVLMFLRKRRIGKFVNEFPNAMDVIVRGVKAGLPLGDCLRIIASEAAEPVRSEFRAIVEAQTLGLPVGDAVQRLYQRMPVQEANFFGIVIQIQQKSGGNLSEVLGNLSRVIRERRKMRGKITAMSMEAKASAAIIGALPLIVMLLVYISSPHYIELLWTREYGRFGLAIGAGMMAAGIAVMRKMINFDI
jgi:tight adherence protein B